MRNFPRKALPVKRATALPLRPAGPLAVLLASLLLLCPLTACSTSSEQEMALANTVSDTQEVIGSEETVADDGQADALGDASPAPSTSTDPAAPTAEAASDASEPLDYRSLPAYEGNPYVYVYDGEPAFSDADRAADPGTEAYGELDRLGRCTGAFAVVGPETQPTEKRGSIGAVKPSGWHLVKYDFVDGKYLFNRCHLLGFQLTGENANECNLITGTRYLNVDGMLPFENAVDDYVDATGNHVLMRVTPVFDGDELVARGVQMEAESVEDDGDGVSFNVYCYNVQPGVVIDYATGDSMLAEDATPLPDVSGSTDSKKGDKAAQSDASQSEKGNGSSADASKGKQDYVLNTNSKKFHKPSCSSVKQMADKNREDVKDTRENILNRGYDPCKRCNP